MNRIDEIKARLAAATKGPWTWDTPHTDKDRLIGPGGKRVLWPVAGRDMKDLGIRTGEWGSEEAAHNAALIANAPTDLEHLLSLVEDGRRAAKEACEGAASLREERDKLLERNSKLEEMVRRQNNLLQEIYDLDFVEDVWTEGHGYIQGAVTNTLEYAAKLLEME